MCNIFLVHTFSNESLTDAMFTYSNKWGQKLRSYSFIQFALESPDNDLEEMYVQLESILGKHNQNEVKFLSNE